MNEPMPGDEPAHYGTPPGRRHLPGPARRPLGTPGSAPAPQTPATGAHPAETPTDGPAPHDAGPPAASAPAPEGSAGADPYPGAEPPEVGSPEGDPPGAAEPRADDDGPQPLGIRLTPTGHAPVDAQLRRLEDADHLAVSGHLEVYEDVHRGLRDTLTALDRHDSRS